jgi:predicted DNA-binding transcriptional regulator AlpA
LRRTTPVFILASFRRPQFGGASNVTKTATSKRQAAQQVAASKKAAALKAAGDEKRPQPEWLQQGLAGKTPLPQIDLPDNKPERVRAADRAQGPPRLMSKPEVLAIVGVSYPTLWEWMRKGRFPRARVLGGFPTKDGKSAWLSSEIDEWLAGLPVRRLKGDEAVS